MSNRNGSMQKGLQWRIFVSVLVLLLTGCATSSPIGEIDAKLMARNFLHGRTDVKRAPGVQRPNVPYRYMTDFTAEKVSGNDLTISLPDGESAWSVRINVTEGEYRGTHRVIIDSDKKEVIAWNPKIS